MSQPQGKCPLCGESNLLSLPYCRHCDYRLPWADKLEGIEVAEQPAPDSSLTRSLKSWDLLPARTLTCRYCNQPITVDAKQCPHCNAWLVARRGRPMIDPWQKDFNPKDFERTRLKPTGCTAPMCLIVAMAMLLRYWL